MNNVEGLFILHEEGNIKDYIVKGGDINLTDEDGKSLLQLTVENEQMDNVRRLLSKGADVNHQDNEGKTALHIALEKENEALVELLILKGADIYLKDKNGKSSFDRSPNETFDDLMLMSVEEAQKTPEERQAEKKARNEQKQKNKNVRQQQEVKNALRKKNRNLTYRLNRTYNKTEKDEIEKQLMTIRGQLWALGAGAGQGGRRKTTRKSKKTRKGTRRA